MKNYLLPVIIVILLFVVGWYYSANKEEITTGSVSVSNEYRSVRTGEVSGNDNGIIMKSSQGVLGSVVVTGIADGGIIIYNATTSDVTLRAIDTLSLEVLVHLPKSVAVGVYTYDIVANIGLVLDVDGAQPTTTVTFR